MAVRYNRAKPITYRATIGKSGKLVKQWKVSRSAPLGKATVKIGIAGEPKPYTALVSFTVVK